MRRGFLEKVSKEVESHHNRFPGHSSRPRWSPDFRLYCFWLHRGQTKPYRLQVTPSATPPDLPGSMEMWNAALACKAPLTSLTCCPKAHKCLCSGQPHHPHAPSCSLVPSHLSSNASASERPFLPVLHKAAPFQPCPFTTQNFYTHGTYFTLALLLK